MKLRREQKVRSRSPGDDRDDIPRLRCVVDSHCSLNTRPGVYSVDGDLPQCGELAVDKTKAYKRRINVSATLIYYKVA